MSWLGTALQQDVTVLHGQSATDSYGNKRVSWLTGHVTSTTMRGYVQGMRRFIVESTTDEQTVEERGVAFLPPEAVVVETDRIEVGGVTWNVAGINHRYFSGRAHLEVQVRREIGGPA